MADHSRRASAEIAVGHEPAEPPPQLPSLGYSSEDYNSFAYYSPVSPPTSPPASASRHSLASLRGQTIREVDEHDDDAAHGASRGSRNASRTPTPAHSRRASTAQTASFALPLASSGIPSPGIYSPLSTADAPPGGFSPATPGISIERSSPEPPSDYGAFKQGTWKSTGSRATSLFSGNEYQQYMADTDTTRLRANTAGARSIRSAFDNNFRPDQDCPTARDFYISKFSWLSISITLLCLFSTVFSGIFLGLALRAPRYGHMISSSGSLKPSDAIILTSIFAKLIELSFVTSFVAFLGQVLSRRAFMKEQGRGVSLSELSMWRWVVQPGTLVTHFESARYAGLTVLGLLSLLSTILATCYSTAATALVQPQLVMGHWEKVTFASDFQTDFANASYLHNSCETPIRTDEEEGGNTCIQLEDAGQGYYNYQRYLTSWNQVATLGNGTTDQRRRPPGFGLLFDNTTVSAQWINVADTAKLSKDNNRTVNSVSLAFPHSGVFQAARDKRNKIMQPADLDSEGSYFIQASVPSPVINVLCANMEEDELSPIVYQKWSNENVNGTTWREQMLNATTTNDTVVDDLFGWPKKSPKGIDYPPVFAKLPKPFNTVLNHTRGAWGRDAIYLLGQGGADTGTNLTGIYVLCKLHMTLSPKCSTRYGVGGISGKMESHCEDDEDEMAYDKTYPKATTERMIPDWMDVGFDWSNSLSLNSGIDDGDASNARLLTQLILNPKSVDESVLNPALPSISEALAVMAGSTLLKSAQGAPYVSQFNYTTAPPAPVTQWFPARLQAQQYASGGTDSTSRAWLAVLLLVFLMDLFVLIYFLFHRGLVTDFSEPPNLFALSINSPPSHLLAGSCGGGPKGEQYSVGWFVNTEGDHLFMEPGVLATEPKPPSTTTPQQPQTGFLARPRAWFAGLRHRGLHIGRTKNQQRLRPASVVNYEMDGQSSVGSRTGPYGVAGPEAAESQTRFGRQYSKLSKRRSML